jgi:high-affinity Fe2+/Pb2+ permease
MAKILSHFVHVEGKETTTATWLKLCVAVVAIAVAFVCFKLVVSSLWSVFLDPFWSFATLVMIAAALYYVSLFALRVAAKRDALKA